MINSTMSSPNFIPSTVYGVNEYGESISNPNESGRRKNPGPKSRGSRETAENDFTSAKEEKSCKN